MFELLKEYKLINMKRPPIEAEDLFVKALIKQVDAQTKWVIPLK
jgi:hypothetical protein